MNANSNKKEKVNNMSEKQVDSGASVSKADFIRNWLKNNKDFSSKWMSRLFEDLQGKGFKVAKHDSIYVYTIKSKLEKMSGKKHKTKKINTASIKKDVKVLNKSSDKDERSSFYKVADLTWHLKNLLKEKSVNLKDLQEAIKLLEYLECR